MPGCMYWLLLLNFFRSLYQVIRLRGRKKVNKHAKYWRRPATTYDVDGHSTEEKSRLLGEVGEDVTVRSMQ